MRRIFAALLALTLSVSPAFAALQQAGVGMYFPALFEPNGYFGAPALVAATAMSGANTAAEISLIGRLKGASSFAGTKNIQSVEFYAGSITAASSSIVIDIEGISGAAGNPAQPDGTVCNSGGTTLTVALASLTANAWNNAATVGNFGSTCTLSENASISVNFKWSGTPGGTASFTINGTGIQSAGSIPSTATTSNGSTWTSGATLPNVVINFDDGSVGTIDGGYVFSSYTSTGNYGSGSSPNEFGNQFIPPFAGAINGIWVLVGSNATASQLTAEITNSSGTVIGSASTTISGFQYINTGGSQRVLILGLPETTLTAGTTYYMGARASAASTIVSTYVTVASASHLGLTPGGTAVQYSTRSGASWAAATNTRRVMMGVRYSQLSDGAGGGSGGGGIIGGSLEKKYHLPDPALPPTEWLAQLTQLRVAPQTLPRLQ